MDDKEYYLNIAKAVAQKSTCYYFKEGSILVNKEGRIISSGYNGAVHGVIDCRKEGYCPYEAEMGCATDKSQEKCMGLHAELNALLGIKHEDTEGSTLYIYCEDRETGKVIVPVIEGVSSKVIQSCNIKEVVIEGTDI